jgi:hypothetical protein
MANTRYAKSARAITPANANDMAILSFHNGASNSGINLGIATMTPPHTE